MSERAFDFALKAALEKAAAALRAREAAHASSVRILSDEQARLASCRRALEKTQALVDATREQLASPRAGRVDGADLVRVNRCVNGLRAVAEREREAVVAAGKRVDLAAERVRVCRRELEAAFNRARGMERIRETRRMEHLVSSRRAAERAEEESALRAWAEQ